MSRLLARVAGPLSAHTLDGAAFIVPSLEGLLARIVLTLGVLVCHERNMRPISRDRHPGFFPKEGTPQITLMQRVCADGVIYTGDPKDFVPGRVSWRVAHAYKSRALTTGKETMRRYAALAQAEARAGSTIAAENHYQHAEHYFRSMSSGSRST